MGVRASLSALLSTSTLAGPVRVSLTAANVAESLAGPIRVSGSLVLAANPLGGASRVSGSYLLVATSLEGGDALFLDTLESDSIIYGVDSYSMKVAIPPTPEFNPYKPLVPEISDKVGADAFTYLQENQETLRNQHNLTQAGDTTFPYQMSTSGHTIQHYKLGSVGKFYHPDFGVIQARYVQFKNMVAVDTPHCPVGLLHTEGGLNWQVTNDLDKSNPDLVVGISAPWVLPDNSSYGWVIVDGPILQQVSNDSTDYAIGESFAWSATGRVSNSAAGKVIGRRVAKAASPKLLAGAMWVRAESFSEAQINQLVTSSTQDLLAELQSLEQEIALLPSASELAGLQTLVTSLQLALMDEASLRIAADLRLNDRIGSLSFVTIDQLNAAVNAAVSSIEAELAVVTANVAFIRAGLTTQTIRIDVLYGLTTDLQAQIDAIRILVLSLMTPKSYRFPVVDGSVPPNLVYLDDGSLVYTETSI